DHVAVRAFEMDVPPGILAGDPVRFARRQRDLPVNRQGKLERNAGTAEPESGQPARQRALRGFAAGTERHLDPRPPKTGDPLARSARVRILQRDDDARRPGLEQEVGTSRAARTLVRARLQRDVDAGIVRAFSSLRERYGLCVWPSAGSSRTFADNPPGRGND